MRPASTGGLIFMLTLMFSSAYPGAHAAFWQYFGASLSQSVFALCFVAFLVGRADGIWSVRAWKEARHGGQASGEKLSLGVPKA